jgi:acetoacetyl-CoA synthetase
VSASALQPIWTPSAERIARANITALIAQVAKRAPSVNDYASLYAWSIDDLAGFWSELWDFLTIIGDKGETVVTGDGSILGTRWFPDARLNFAENHLRRRDDAVALVGRSEGGPRREMTWRALYDAVSRLRAAFAAMGVQPGDRIASFLPNVPETVIACLAATSLGAIWSACSPDYGLQAVLDRFSQIEPKVLLIADGYRYGGKTIALAERNDELARQLPSLERVIFVPFLDEGAAAPDLPGAVSWAGFIAPFAAREIVFERFAFDHPVYILYSSGTTGKPKAIIHGAGGSLLQSVKEMVVHCDCRPDEPVFFQTTAGWVVWNIMLGAMPWGSPIVLYDGAPTYPETALLDVLAEEHVGVARLVPPLYDSYIRAGLTPAASHDLSALRCILSGSAPLLPHHYEYVYGKLKHDLHLLSPAGGTDLMGSLVSGNPAGPVYPGIIQGRTLGMAVEIFDEQGKPLIGQPGELVCTKPFPSVPLGFWGDRNRERVREAYFSTFPGVWRHGDWAELKADGGVVIYGRADATLKVNGVRIGTAEIYRGLEKVREVAEAVAVTQRRGNDERIVLFVVTGQGITLDAALAARIGQAIRDSATARHVPAKIVQVPDLLRSLNGKPSEIAVRNAINGEPLSGQLGLSNPQAITLFTDIAALRDWA